MAKFFGSLRSAAFNFVDVMKLLIVGAIVLYLAYGTEFSSAVLSQLDRGLFIAAIAVQPLLCAGLFLLAVRHVLLLGGPRVNIFLGFKSMALSLGLNLVIPGRLSELLKATYLRNRAGVPLTRGLAAIALERTVDLLIVAALGGLALVIFFDRGNFAAIPAIGMILALLLFLIVRFPEMVIRFIHVLPSARLGCFLEKTYIHFSSTIKTRNFWQALLLGVLAWGFSYITIFLFLKLAGSIPVGFSGALMVFVMTTLGGAIPALPGGLGTYEAAAVVALRSLGYGFDEALALALAIHTSQLVLPFILAILIMLTERIGVSSLIADLRRSAAVVTDAGSDTEKGNAVND